MSDGKEPVKGPAKTIRVSTDMHKRFRAHQHNVHADSAEEAMSVLLGDNVLHIPMPAVVMDRWREEAKACGYPLEQWVAQCVETWLANRVSTPEIREALALKRAMAETGLAHGIFTGEAPPGVDPEAWARRRRLVEGGQ